MLTIWGRASSVNVQKVLWAADELSLAYERIDAGGKFGGLDDPAYLARNPNGVIPTIADTDGTVVWESNSIVRYLAGRYAADGSGLWPADPVRRAAADRWMDWTLTTIGEPMRVLFWGFVRAPQNAVPAEMAKATAESGRLWARLDAWLGQDGRSFVAGDRLTIGDILAACQLQRWLNFPIDRPRLPHLDAWHARLTERPGYRQWVMVTME